MVKITKALSGPKERQALGRYLKSGGRHFWGGGGSEDKEQRPVHAPPVGIQGSLVTRKRRLSSQPE